MSKATAVKTVPSPVDLPALVAAFLLVVGFTFSDDIVEFVGDLTGHRHFAGHPWFVFALDLLLVVCTAALKWRISGGGDPGRFLRGLIAGWWGAGAALVVVAHLTLILTGGHQAGLGDVASVWVNLLASAVFVTAMALLLFSALSEGSSSRAWIIPLVIGSFVAQVASALWYPVINIDNDCANEVSARYFIAMTTILPVVLLALAVELNYLRRNMIVGDPGRRVAPVLTAMMLCVGMVLSFTMLVKAEQGPLCGMGAVWHEYFTFVITAQALSIGLATLMWLLVTDAVEGG